MRSVEVNIDIKVKPEKIIRAFTDPEMLLGWWGVERSLIELRQGGAYTLAWKITEDGFGFVSSGTIKEYQPARILEIENMVYLNPERSILGLMSLVIKAQEKDGITELFVRQGGYKEGQDWDWYYLAVKDAWPSAVKILKDYLEKE